MICECVSFRYDVELYTERSTIHNWRHLSQTKISHYLFEQNVSSLSSQVCMLTTAPIVELCANEMVLI